MQLSPSNREEAIKMMQASSLRVLDEAALNSLLRLLGKEPGYGKADAIAKLMFSTTCPPVVLDLLRSIQRMERENIEGAYTRLHCQSEANLNAMLSTLGKRQGSNKADAIYKLLFQLYAKTNPQILKDIVERMSSDMQVESEPVEQTPARRSGSAMRNHQALPITPTPARRSGSAMRNHQALPITPTPAKRSGSAMRNRQATTSDRPTSQDKLLANFSGLNIRAGQATSGRATSGQATTGRATSGQAMWV
jgi:hypothetical protein